MRRSGVSPRPCERSSENRTVAPGEALAGGPDGVVELGEVLVVEGPA